MPEKLLQDNIGLDDLPPDPGLPIIFPKRIKLLPVYAFVHFVDSMQVFDGIICKKLLVLIIAGE
jgi:hypothetical protein